MKLDDTNDLRTYMLQMKEWAHAQGEKDILGLIERAERRGGSASELVLGYGEALRAIQERYLNRLPDQFQSHVAAGIKVSADAINLGSYTYRAS